MIPIRANGEFCNTLPLRKPALCVLVTVFLCFVIYGKHASHPLNGRTSELNKILDTYFHSTPSLLPS